MDSKKKEAKQLSLLEKKKEKERAKAEAVDDIKFNTTLGNGKDFRV